MDGIGLVLDVAGFIPIIGSFTDVANASIRLVRGDYMGAAMNIVGAVPGVGDAAKTAYKANKIAKGAEAAGKAAKGADIAGENPTLYGYVNEINTWIDLFGLSRAPSQILFGNLKKGFIGEDFSGFQAHHVIPTNVWKEYQTFFNVIGLGRLGNEAFNGQHI